MIVSSNILLKQIFLISQRSLTNCNQQNTKLLDNYSLSHHRRNHELIKKMSTSQIGVPKPASSNTQPEIMNNFENLNQKDNNSTSESPSISLELTPELIHHLERTSLVDFDNVEGLRRLEQAVEFANKILEVDTTGVEPMSTVLEEIVLHLREDIPVKTNRDDILANASVTDEDYFVSPPGNIPLELDKSSIKFKAQ